MLDLVKHETERIDSRFLEPACGNGNFLAEVLRRKLTVVTDRYAKSRIEWERYAVLAVSSIYGVDILQDNVAECRDRLFDIFDQHYTKLFRDECNPECCRSVQFILNRNILWGDALNLKTPDEKAEPIIFSEWAMAPSVEAPCMASLQPMMKRRDFTLANLLQGDLQAFNERGMKKTGMGSLFSDEGDPAFLPTPIKDFPLMHFFKLSEMSEPLPETGFLQNLED
ncbi:type III restriction endonuclease subunit M [Bacteroidia bacterium]|nr:type III restriction endonuclease subunit M [Bacteroidia bacterium]